MRHADRQMWSIPPEYLEAASQGAHSPPSMSILIRLIREPDIKSLRDTALTCPFGSCTRRALAPWPSTRWAAGSSATPIGSGMAVNAQTRTEVTSWGKVVGNRVKRQHALVYESHSSQFANVSPVKAPQSTTIPGTCAGSRSQRPCAVRAMAAAQGYYLSRCSFSIRHEAVEDRPALFITEQISCA